MQGEIAVILVLVAGLSSSACDVAIRAEMFFKAALSAFSNIVAECWQMPSAAIAQGN